LCKYKNKKAMPVKKLVKKIKSAVARRRRPGVVSKVKKVVKGKDGKSKVKTTRSTGVTNSTRSRYRTSNMTDKGVDMTRKPKATVTKDNRKGTGYRKKTVTLDRTKARSRKDLVGKITKTKKNIVTGKTKTTTKNVTAKKARRVLKRMDRKTDRMINRAARKTARQKRRSKR